MAIDPRDETLEKIQNIANSLCVAYDMSVEVREYLDIIEALTRHSDNPGCVDTKETELLARVNGASG